MAVQVLDSPLRCPRDGKRMFLELGQHDSHGALEMTHECWSCGYTEASKRGSREVTGDGRTLAELLKAQRLGDVVLEVADA
jgi:hypothetical protein